MESTIIYKEPFSLGWSNLFFLLSSSQLRLHLKFHTNTYQTSPSNHMPYIARFPITNPAYYKSNMPSQSEQMTGYWTQSPSNKDQQPKRSNNYAESTYSTTTTATITSQDQLMDSKKNSSTSSTSKQRASAFWSKTKKLLAPTPEWEREQIIQGKMRMEDRTMYGAWGYGPGTGPRRSPIRGTI